MIRGTETSEQLHLASEGCCIRYADVLELARDCYITITGDSTPEEHAQKRSALQTVRNLRLWGL